MKKSQVTYKGRLIRTIAGFWTQTIKARRSCADVKQTIGEHKWQPRLLHPAKLSINIDGETKKFHDKTKFTQYISTNPALQRIIDGKLQHKEGNYKYSQNMKKIIFQQTWKKIVT